MARCGPGSPRRYCPSQIPTPPTKWTPFLGIYEHIHINTHIAKRKRIATNINLAQNSSNDDPATPPSSRYWPTVPRCYFHGVSVGSLMRLAPRQVDHQEVRRVRYESGGTHVKTERPEQPLPSVHSLVPGQCRQSRSDISFVKGRKRKLRCHFGRRHLVQVHSEEVQPSSCTAAFWFPRTISFVASLSMCVPHSQQLTQPASFLAHQGPNNPVDLPIGGTLSQNSPLSNTVSVDSEGVDDSMCVPAADDSGTGSRLNR